MERHNDNHRFIIYRYNFLIDGSLFKPITNDEDRVLIQPFAIQRPYIIYASRITHEQKCHVELIKAFALFKKQTGSPHRLVIAGSDGNNSEAVHNAVIQSGFSSDILLTGYFPHESLPQLYSSADLCVFPSETRQPIEIKESDTILKLIGLSND